NPDCQAEARGESARHPGLRTEGRGHGSQRAASRRRRHRSWPTPNTRSAPSEASALAQPPPVPAVAPGASFTTMNPLSSAVVQTSPEVIPRSFGKLGFEVAKSKLRTNGAGTEFAYCDPGKAFVPWAGGLMYATSRTALTLLMSKKRTPAAKQLQAASFASSTSSTLQ